VDTGASSTTTWLPGPHRPSPPLELPVGSGERDHVVALGLRRRRGSRTPRRTPQLLTWPTDPTVAVCPRVV
jgi:hypothetical protein